MKAPPAIPDRVRAGRRAKARGKRGESQVVDILKAHGWTNARRNWAEIPQRGRDILGGPAGTWISVKLTERLKLREAYTECSAGAGLNTPIVVHRANGQPWLATIELDELLSLLALRERS